MFDFPDVPNLPGVPNLLRVPQSAFNFVSQGLGDASSIMRGVSAIARSNPLAALSTIAPDILDAQSLMGGVQSTITNYATSIMGRFIPPVASITAGLTSIADAITASPSAALETIADDIGGTTAELGVTDAAFDEVQAPEEALDGVETVTVTAVKLDAQWGIFKDGKTVIQADSVAEFGIKKDWTISDYPVEDGGFQSYNKVYVPFDARIKFTAGGSRENRAALIEAIDAIAGDLLTYDVAMPEQIYPSVNVVHYDIRRRADNGLGLLIVDVYLQEIRKTATAEFSTAAADPAAVSPAPAPKSPTAAPKKNNGTTQAVTPARKYLNEINEAMH